MATSGWRVRLQRYAPLVLWIGVILLLGSGAGSMPETSRFIGPILRFFFPDASAELLLVYHGFIRKSAHFAEYGVLALFALRAFRRSPNPLVAKHWPAASLLLVTATAAADEFIQSFNSARTGSLWDVLIDICGGIVALTFVYLIRRRSARSAVHRPRAKISSFQ